MQLLYSYFYKQFGIRRLQGLLSPRLIDLQNLPRDSMLHYCTFTEDAYDVDESKLYFQKYSKKILVDYAETLTSAAGMPKRNSALIRPLIRPFHAHSKVFRYLKDHYRTINDPQSLLVINYNYLNALYRYVELPMTAYNKWLNIEKTLWDTINTIASKSSRQHFVFVNVPKELPSVGILNIYLDKINPQMLKLFDSPDKLFLLHLWRWLSPEHRQQSAIASLDKANLNKVNIVFTNSDNKSAILNLGYLNSWTTGEPNTTEFSNIIQLDPVRLQRLMLKFEMTLQVVTPPEEVVQTDESLADSKPVDELDAEEEKEIEEETREYNEENPPDEEQESTDDSSYNDAFYSYAKKDETEFSSVNRADADTVDNSDFLVKQFDDIDSDLEILEKMNMKKLKEHGIHVDSTSDATAYAKTDAPEVIDPEAVKQAIYEDKDYVQALVGQLDENAEYGMLSAMEYKKLLADINKYAEMKDPYGSKQTVVEAMVVKPEDIQLDKEKITIAASDMVLDKTMLESSLLSFDRDYINKVLHKDILGMINSLQKTGVVIKKHEVEMDNSALGSYENHTIELKPIDGMPSSLRFRIPKISEDGTFTANGNKYIMRKQRVDVPIRKIDPHTVALTSYYGKNFVALSQKKANSSLEWLIKQINLASVTEGAFISKVAPAKVFDNNFKAPYIYNALADNFKSFKAGKYHFMFDHTMREELAKRWHGVHMLEELETNGRIVVGISTAQELILVDEANEFLAFKDGKLTELGNIFTLLQLPVINAPVDFTEVRIFSKTIPVGVVLAYFIGFKKLLTFLNVPYRVVEGRKNKALEANEYAISFKDESYIFSRKHRVASIVLGGFIDYDKQIKQYLAEDFDNKDVYFNLLASKGLSALYIRELELTDKAFVDPITKSILEDMGEPTTFRGLLIRATEMLQTYHHEDSQDMAVMRVRGYERISGVIYKEMIASIRSFRNRNIAGKSKVDMSPYQIWQTVMKDPAIKLVEDINPIQNLKESEVVTYVGEGGRGKDSMNRKSRAYHMNDMGIVSEATVDSSDVGINAYLSANPNFKNLRGLASPDKNLSITKLVSTSALLAPGAAHDDPKRVNFISIQQGHTIAAAGYHQPYVRTGYEYVISSRTSDMFAYNAKAPGKVIGKTKNGILVEYQDGERKGVALGRIYGKAEGSVYPHDIISNLEVGDVFQKGDNIAYNTGFFEPDFLDPKRVILKNSMSVKTALYESNQTHEDSSSISKDLSKKLTAKTTKMKSITVEFTQNLLNVVKPGQKIFPKDILMIIEDEITSTTTVFDEESLSVLKKLSSQAPSSKYTGTIDKIEVFYHGNKEDMSPSLLALVERSDKYMADVARATNNPVITGQVNDDYRVSGVPLAMDKAEIKIYITIETSAGVGDKGVFANQMKSVFGEVMDYDMHTEDGEKIHAVFGYRSIAARIVLSPEIIGTTTTLLKVIGKLAVKLYKG